MNSIYHRDIVNILLPHGKEGLKVTQIARQIYNMHTDLFVRQENFCDMRRKISIYLWKQCQKRESIFLRNSYGIYSIKPDIAIQLDLFWDYKIDEEEDIGNSEEEQNDSNHVQLELF